MNNKVKQTYEELAQYLGFRFSEEDGILYGEREGFLLRIEPYRQGSGVDYYMLSVSAVIAAGMAELTKAECRACVKEHKPMSAIVQNKNCVTMQLKRYRKQEQINTNVQECLRAFVTLLAQKGYTNGCQVCGTAHETRCYDVSGAVMNLCDDCYTSINQNAAVNENRNRLKKENVVGGIVGALLGSLLGVACIVVLSQLGYVAALSGIVMAVCALRGYELLGGKLTKKGIFISAVLMIVMTYAGDRLDWAIMVARELDTDIFYGYRAIPGLLAQDMIDATGYIANLALVYVFLLLGAVPTIWNAAKKNKLEGTIRSL